MPQNEGFVCFIEHTLLLTHLWTTFFLDFHFEEMFSLFFAPYYQGVI